MWSGLDLKNSQSSWCLLVRELALSILLFAPASHWLTKGLFTHLRPYLSRLRTFKKLKTFWFFSWPCGWLLDRVEELYRFGQGEVVFFGTGRGGQLDLKFVVFRRGIHYVRVITENSALFNIAFLKNSISLEVLILQKSSKVNERRSVGTCAIRKSLLMYFLLRIQSISFRNAPAHGFFFKQASSGSMKVFRRSLIFFSTWSLLNMFLRFHVTFIPRIQEFGCLYSNFCLLYLCDSSILP